MVCIKENEPILRAWFLFCKFSDHCARVVRLGKIATNAPILIKLLLFQIVCGSKMAT
jgi:hypothetical protein